MSRAVYEIRVRGSASRTLLEDFGARQVAADGTLTTIVAELPDQSALRGLIHALCQEGLALVDVRREPMLG